MGGSDKFVSGRGKEYEIRRRGGGLYYIEQLGGGKSAFSNQLFTSYNMAAKALVRYLESRDTFGKAQHPGKVKSAPRENN